MDDIAARLERLVEAFERHGHDVRSNLRPGASTDELDAVEPELGVPLPRAYRALYGWSAGCVDHTRSPALLFRDNAFLPLAEVVGVRRRTIEAYDDPMGAPVRELFGVDLKDTAPLAELMGSSFSVVCGDHRLSPASAHPVISVFQGIDVFFLSIESMIDTCIAWVEQPDYDPSSEAPNELSIWLSHNPGVFE